MYQTTVLAVGQLQLLLLPTTIRKDKGAAPRYRQTGRDRNYARNGSW